MKILCGFIGAILGSVVGIANTVFVAAVLAHGDSFGTMCYSLMFGLMVVGGWATFGAFRAIRVWHQVRQASTKREKAVFVLLPLICTFTAVFAMIQGELYLVNPPSDERMIANFQQHRKTFEQLSAMVQADKGLTRVDENWTQPNDPQEVHVSPARIQKYRDLLNSADVPRGFSSSDTPLEIQFFYYLDGNFASCETTKGYAYLPQPPAKQQKSLNDCPQNGDEFLSEYRHIEGNWYLFYEYLPD